jgi:predicted DNA-binding transcriptional regulator YafY
MATISKSERLLNLVSFLLKARQPVTPAEIRKSVLGYQDDEASDASVERRFERDKAALRELGVPLKFIPDSEPGGPGYVVPRDTYFLPRLRLTSAESAILALAGRFALAGAAGPVSEALQSALRKLQFDSNIPGDIRETAEEHFLFHGVGGAGNERERDNLRALTLAVLGRHAVRFSYYAIGQDRTERRDVEPYGVGFSTGHWYMAGRDRGRGETRVFRTDRIRGEIKRVRSSATLPEFDVPSGFRIQEHIGVPPWLYGEATIVEVRIDLDADVAFMVRMYPAPEDRWEDRPDGSGVLTRKATNTEALLNWVLGLGRHARVLHPPEFREQAVKALKEVAAAHADPAGGGRP